MIEDKMDKNDQENLTEMQKINPHLVYLALKYPEDIEPSPELRERVLEMARAHKRKLEREGKLNNSDWLVWLEPIITPIKDLRSWFTLDGFLPSNLRVVARLLVIISVISGLSYLIYYEYNITGENILISENTKLIIKPQSVVKNTGERGNNQNENVLQSLQSLKSIYVQADQKQEKLNNLAILVSTKLSSQSQLAAVSSNKLEHDAILSIKSEKQFVVIDIIDTRILPGKSLWSKKYDLINLSTLSNTIVEDFLKTLNNQAKRPNNLENN